MKKNYDQILLKSFVFATLPIWTIVLVAERRGSLADGFNTLAGLLLVLWLLTLVTILAKLVLVATYREKVLSTIFGIKAKDEREEVMSGIAAKKGHFFSMAVICTLLFISTLKITLTTPTQEERGRGKQGALSIGFDYSFVSKKAITKERSELSLHELPLSKEGILSLMLLLQIASYHLYFRRRVLA